MSFNIIDRRLNDKGKSIPNRQRLLRRIKDSLKDSIKEGIIDSDVKNFGSDKQVITIPKRGLSLPEIKHGKFGVKNIVVTGNEKYVRGDKIPKQGGQGNGGKKGSPDGQGDDEFKFELSRDELLDLFFEDMELPDFIKNTIKAEDNFENRRAGFITDGTPARLNIQRSLVVAKSRKTALIGPKRKRLKALKKELEELLVVIDSTKDEESLKSLLLRKDELETEIKKLKKKIAAIPFIDEYDLRYNHWVKHPVPTNQAVMFCMMDVSASMGEWEKEMAKRFYILLHLFLSTVYEKVDVVFIRHHSTAKEVDHDEFFYSTETGGTIVSSALDVMTDIVKERYNPNDWNIYACQASDGDNFVFDNPKVHEVMTQRILPICQYYAYIELDEHRTGQSDIWSMYENFAQNFKNISIRKIHHIKDIIPVFRKLFEKENS